MNLKDKRQKLVRKLTNKEYRHAWIEESVKMALPYQIQANREKRDWSQAILGKEADMKQNAISRLESMDYGNLTINTLLRLAYGFDCGLLVKLVPFSRLVKEFEDVSPEALEVESFEEDIETLESWADADILDSSILTTNDTRQNRRLTLVASNPESVIPNQQTLKFQRGEIRLATVSTNRFTTRAENTVDIDSDVVNQTKDYRPIRMIR